ncbi:hypothetical protein T265_04915 [Opisthorchis viverrini]|uniref:Uncharacterized protein n=1 Tax=Opisthorchis viverrini TaxID=6198 RepID=A0A075AG02_OPIVI|nr:hypothetical protein T265_04915 [Opisthorchis viverrini]KER28244.1 hypothetical protein T265_04915 [Opisthorchis viverrini]
MSKHSSVDGLQSDLLARLVSVEQLSANASRNAAWLWGRCTWTSVANLALSRRAARKQPFVKPRTCENMEIEDADKIG